MTTAGVLTRLGVKRSEYPVTARQLEILQHTVGADQYGQRKRDSNRNHFCAGPADEPDCRELVALGLMRQHETTKWLPYFNCSATDAGIKVMRESSPNPPKLTASQKRYRAYLDADCDRSFGEWLKDGCYKARDEWSRSFDATGNEIDAAYDAWRARG